MDTPQKWNPETYALHGQFVPDLGKQVIEWLNPKPRERILDLGCGDGQLTYQLAKLGCNVVGFDKNPEFLKVAKGKGIDVRLGDAIDLDFHDEFDAVFSNAVLHWIEKPDAVIKNVWQALKKGGRFVGELGGEGNIKSIIDALHEALGRRGVNATGFNPWYFPGSERFQQLLESQGFLINQIYLG